MVSSVSVTTAFNMNHLTFVPIKTETDLGSVLWSSLSKDPDSLQVGVHHSDGLVANIRAEIGPEHGLVSVLLDREVSFPSEKSEMF